MLKHITTLAMLFADQAKLTEAIGSYNRAISIKPDYAEAYCHMGIALNDQGKLNESIEAYEKATTYKLNI